MLGGPELSLGVIPPELGLRGIAKSGMSSGG